MGRGRRLTEAQVAVVLELAKDFLSPAKIAERIHKSRSAVRNVLRKNGHTTPDSPLGRPKKMTERQVRLIIRQASPNRLTARQLRNLYAKHVSVRSVQRLLNNAAHLGWRKMQAAPKLTPRHRAARVAWARTWLASSSYTRRHTVYSDEKRLCLDGPDGFKYYWADLRREEDPISRRQNDGGGIMIWGCISRSGRLRISFVGGNLNADRYIELLNDVLLPFREAHHPAYCKFQQDGASSHTAKATRRVFGGPWLG